MSIDRDLIKLNSAMTQLMRAIRSVDESSGVGRARLSALAVLHFGGPCSPTELAKKWRYASPHLRQVRIATSSPRV